jgi:hypothetical protein
MPDERGFVIRGWLDGTLKTSFSMPMQLANVAVPTAKIQREGNAITQQGIDVAKKTKVDL